MLVGWELMRVVVIRRSVIQDPFISGTQINNPSSQGRNFTAAPLLSSSQPLQHNPLSLHPPPYLWPDEEVEVPDALVLTHQSGGQPQLTVAVHDADHLMGGGGMGRARESGGVRPGLRNGELEDAREILVGAAPIIELEASSAPPPF